MSSVLVTAMTEPNGGTIAASAVPLFLAVVSTIACITALGVLLYYKMWRKFIYRLVLYTLISLIVLSLSIILLMIVSLAHTTNVGIFVALSVFIYGSLGTAVMLVACMNVCIYLMALHSYQFTYKSDLCLLVSSFFYVIIVVILTIALNVLFLQMDYDSSLVILMIVIGILDLPFLVNVAFTTLALVPLCCRACGYNMCMKTAATIESHRKALKEILPLFLLILPSFLFAFLSGIQFASRSLAVEIIIVIIHYVSLSTAGLSFAIFFAIHLFFVRKSLKKLRAKKRVQRETVNQHHTHHTTAYTSEGMSETCNTEYQLVSENEEDTRFLLQRNNQEQ